jgi:uncharacterized membrane protein
MELHRFARHLCTSHRAQRRAFPPQVAQAIAAAVRAVEQQRQVEIRFVVEASLEPLSLLRRQTPRERALELFALLGVWDTAGNDGVLIYVLLADRAVEIVADRAVAAAVPADAWAAICRRMEASFARRDYEHGALAAIRAVSSAIAATIGDAPRRSELPDRPLML